MNAARETVVILGDFDYEYPREKSLRDGLERFGFRVRECRYREDPLFIGVTKLLLLPYIYVVLWLRMRELVGDDPEVEAIVVTKFNPLLLPFAAWYARRLDALLVYDLFVSLYRTVKLRGLPWPVVKLVYAIERATLPLADLLLTETEQFVRLYADRYSLPKERFIALPVGTDEEWFSPRPDVPEADRFTAVYWGNFLPHHGLETIVDAADRLREEDVRFIMLGEGPWLERTERAVAERGLENVELRGRVPMEDLVETIAAAHVCLGIFSTDVRAQASITNKVSEGIAMGRPVITERSPAVEEWFTHGEDLYLVPPEDPEALAEGILTLAGDPSLRDHIGRGARRRFEETYSKENVGRILVGALGREVGATLRPRQTT